MYSVPTSAPNSCSSLQDSGNTSVANTGYPCFSRFFAIGFPMFPRPMNPTWVFEAIDLVETKNMETIILTQDWRVTKQSCHKNYSVNRMPIKFNVTWSTHALSICTFVVNCFTSCWVIVRLNNTIMLQWGQFHRFSPMSEKNWEPVSQWITETGLNNHVHTGHQNVSLNSFMRQPQGI